MRILQAPVSQIPKSLLRLDSQQCPHCNASLIAQNISPVRISSRFDEALTLAWECPVCYKADVLPGMEAKWADFVKDHGEIWEEINASKDHERNVYARVPAAELYPGCYEAYKDDPECNDNHPRHKRGIALRFTESVTPCVDSGSEEYSRSVMPDPVDPENLEVPEDKFEMRPDLIF